MNKKYIRYGFTLIELMIVIAIIGILAIIAIPQYTNQTAKAQMTEAVNALGGAKVVVADLKSNNGTFPTLAQLQEVYPITSATDTKTKHIQSITLPSVSGYFVMRAIFKSTGTSALLQNKYIDFQTPSNGEGTYWTCIPDSTLQKDLLPAVCK